MHQRLRGAWCGRGAHDLLPQHLRDGLLVHRALRDEAEGIGVDAESLPGGLGAVVEHVADVSPTGRAAHLRPGQ